MRRGVAIDLSPLRASPDLRLLLASRTVTALGSRITLVAALFQVKALTGSVLAVGLLGVAEVIPIVLLSLFGGALADRMDRRTLAVGCELGLAVAAVGLVVNAALPDPALWPIFVCASVIAGLFALQRPSLDAAVPRVVAPEHLTAAAVLLTVAADVASIVGLSLGGILAAGPGVTVAYALDAATFVVSAALLWRLRPIPTRSTARGRIVREIAGGARYAWRHPELRGSYLADLAAMGFAFPYALLPFLADDLGAPWAGGFLLATIAAGGLLASVTSGWTGRVRRHGRVVLLAAATWGVALGLLGVIDSLALAFVLLAVAGAADVVSAVFRDALWNLTIDDDYRGRLAGVEVLSYAGGPPLGQARAGVTADLAGLHAAFWTGGILTAASIAAIWVTHRRLVEFDADELDAGKFEAGKHAAISRTQPG
ncbi:MFS transporter [Patulibacter americanus]|uniref:MFS transporter n=1 Tax=Patulibacter americanus TaxID=588672 RepID=UPI0003B6147E|nr:MFS transporter [Patulibacter americanus]